MIKLIITSVALFCLLIEASSCQNYEALIEASCGSNSEKCSKAGPASVIAMGRDDDDGKTKKWHIGGGKK